MEERYFEWLLNRAGVDEDEHGYSSLCWILFDTPYLPVLEMDENRYEDGLEYREAFSEFIGEDASVALNAVLGGCTMLELILTMAEKMQFEMADSIYEAGTGKWFEELIENLGLDNYTNYCIKMQPQAYDDIQDILERFNLRKYRYDGEGGLFPLSDYWCRDQRKVELIAQMNAYLGDRYDIL